MLLSKLGLRLLQRLHVFELLLLLSVPFVSYGIVVMAIKNLQVLGCPLRSVYREVLAVISGCLLLPRAELVKSVSDLIVKLNTLLLQVKDFGVAAVIELKLV